MDSMFEGARGIDTGTIHRRHMRADIKSQVNAMLAEAEAEMRSEILAGNIVKEALWKGEVTAFKKMIYLLDSTH